jgi:hypothetical protein
MGWVTGHPQKYVPAWLCWFLTLSSRFGIWIFRIENKNPAGIYLGQKEKSVSL